MTKELLIALSFLCFFSSSWGQTLEPFKENINELVYYSADFINANLIKEEAELKGNVKVLFSDYELSAKNAIIYKKEKKIRVWGQVRIESQDSFIEADEATLNYTDKTGTITGVRITSGQLLLEAKTVEKIDETTFIASKASFTTCATCPPGWRIKSKKIKTNIKKYVTLNGGRFQIRNQTILPIPPLTLPLNTRRKSGFIPPSLTRSTGNTGTEFGQPYFWAINDHKDLTFTPKIYFNNILKDVDVNGAKLHLEYNEWLSNSSWLKLNTAYMYDSTYRTINGNPDPTYRWFLQYKNFLELPRGFIQKTNFTLIREREYLNDFFFEVPGRSEPTLKNTFSLSRFKKNRFFSGRVVYHTNLLVEDPFESNNNSIQKLPELRYSLSETSFWNDKLLFKGEANYTHFYRNGRGFDDIAPGTEPNAPKLALGEGGDGVFDPDTDLIRSGQRLYLTGEVSAPFKVSRYFNFMPKLQYRDAYYNFNIDNEQIASNANQDFSRFANSRYFEVSNSIRTEFAKVYGETYKHKVIPELILKLGSRIDQSDNPFFESQGSLPYHRQYQPITDNDFFNLRHGVQFDYNDRFFRAEVAEFKLTNLIIKKNKQDFVTYYDQPFYLSLTQSYDFRNARLSENPDPLSNLDGVLKFRTKYFTNLTQASYFYKSDQLNISTRNRLVYQPGRFVAVWFSDFTTVDERGNLTDNRTQNIDFELGWEFPTFKFSGRLRYSLLDREHLGWETHFLYTPRGNCWGLKVDLFEIANQQSDSIGYGFSAFFNFGPDNDLKKSLDI